VSRRDASAVVSRDTLCDADGAGLRSATDHGDCAMDLRQHQEIRKYCH
jgi:hypothetical protein